jgi:hypothetical protein
VSNENLDEVVADQQAEQVRQIRIQAEVAKHIRNSSWLGLAGSAFAGIAVMAPNELSQALAVGACSSLFFAAFRENIMMMLTMDGEKARLDSMAYQALCSRMDYLFEQLRGESNG